MPIFMLIHMPEDCSLESSHARVRAHPALLWCRVDVLFGSTDVLVERMHCILCQAVLAGLCPNAPAYAVLVLGGPQRSSARRSSLERLRRK